MKHKRATALRNFHLKGKMTATELLRSAKISQSIAEEVICRLLNVSAKELFLTKDTMEVPGKILAGFNDFQKEILDGAPYQYLIRKSFFGGREFSVDQNVLIPRAETELMVEQAGRFIKSRAKKRASKEGLKIIDVGTGSGCIAISLYLLVGGGDFYACDKSAAALKVARRNAKRHEAKIKFFQSDLFLNPRLPPKYDLILANLPYLNSDYESNFPQLKHEPRVALDGGAGGLELIFRLIDELPRKLKGEGLAILEIDPAQKKALITKIKGLLGRSWKFDFTQDLSGLDRHLLIWPEAKS